VTFDGGESFARPAELSARRIAERGSYRAFGGAEAAGARQTPRADRVAPSRSATTATRIIFDDGHDTGLYTLGLISTSLGASRTPDGRPMFPIAPEGRVAGAGLSPSGMAEMMRKRLDNDPG